MPRRSADRSGGGAWATSFIDDRCAGSEHQCTKCNAVIGLGDHYRREAIPPWGYEDQAEEGVVIRYSVGHWSVFKLCHDCKWMAGAA